MCTLQELSQALNVLYNPHVGFQEECLENAAQVVLKELSGLCPPYKDLNTNIIFPGSISLKTERGTIAIFPNAQIAERG